MKRTFLVLILLSLGFFYPVFSGKIPYPGNLMYSTYAPWYYDGNPLYQAGLPNKPMGFDDFRQMYPYWTVTRDALQNGRFPKWNPYIFSGTPHIAAFDSAVFYPLSLILTKIPINISWTFLVVLQPILAGFFMFLLIRKLKFEWFVQLFGACTYAFSGWMIGYWEEALVLEHTVLWIPLVFYALLGLWEGNGKIRWFVLLTLALTCSILAGFFQIALYVIISACIWDAYLFWQHRSEKNAQSALIQSISAFVISMLICSMQIIPTAEGFLNSPRIGSDSSFLFRNFLLHPEHLITFLIPDFWGNIGTYNFFSNRGGFYFEKLIYIGFFPFLFMLNAIVGNEQKTYSLFWKIAAVISLSLAFTLPTSWIFYIFRIPVLSTAMPIRILSVFCFFASVLTAYGLQTFIDSSTRTVWKKLLIGITVLFVSIWIFLGLAFYANSVKAPEPVDMSQAGIIEKGAYAIQSYFRRWNIRYYLYATIAFRNTVIPTCFLMLAWIVYMLKNRWKTAAIILAFTATVSGSLYFSRKILYFSDSQVIFPQTPILTRLKDVSGYNRVWGYGNAYMEKNLLVPYRLYSPDGYGAIFARFYGELLSGIQNNGKIDSVIRRSDADLFQVSESESLGKGNQYRLRMMSLLGIKYVLETKSGDKKEKKTTEERFPENLFIPVYEDDIWRIWEYKNALPRAFFTPHAEIIENDNDLVYKLYNPSTNLRNTLYISSCQKSLPDEFRSPPDAEHPMPDAKTEILQYDPEYVKISVETGRNGMVFLSDNYYPGWVAYVDGKQTDILRADYSFRAVIVDKGNHVIEFRYEPVSFRVGIWLSVAGILLFTGSIYILRKSI